MSNENPFHWRPRNTRTKSWVIFIFTEIKVGDQTLIALSPVAVLPEMQSKA